MKIGDFELVDLGIEHSQYFQGFGTSFTRFQESAYGIGNDPREALDDCLEQIASAGFDTEDLESRILDEFPAFADESANVANSVESYLREENPDEWFDENGEFDGAECELYYHIGIRFNPAAEDADAEDADAEDADAEAPNLDGMWPDDLREYAEDSANPAALRDYARIKAQAMEARASGDVAAALVWERDCERIYSKLPAALKW